MLDFLKTPAGIAVFCVFVVAVVIIVIEVNYKYFTKRWLDFLFALIGVVLCSPVLIPCAILSKRRSEGGKVLESKAYLGGKGQIVKLHAFAGVQGKVRYVARILDVLAGRMSFVGVKALPVEDGALMDDGAMERFTARPGLLTHLSLRADSELTFEEMFERDVHYAKRRELFYDFWIVVMHVVLLLRGEHAGTGETAQESYTQALLARGEITAEEAESARAYAAEAVAEDEKAKNFRKERLKR